MVIEFYNMPKYTISNGVLKLFGVGESGSAMVDPPEKPYGFVDNVSAIAYVSDYSFVDSGLMAVDGKRAYRFETQYPAQVGELGKKLWQAGIMSYETDVPYVRRLYIDNKIKTVYKDVCFIDVELDDSKGFRDYGDMPLLSISWAFLSDKIVKHGHVEDGVYVDLANDMRSRNCYLICGWNVEFDYNHLIAQRRMGRDYAVLRNILQRSERIDLRDPYKRAVIGLGVYSLENVSIYEGFKPKQRTKKVAELSKTELREYNNYDVELLLKIEEKYRFLERLLKMSETFNIPVSEIMAGETVVWDYLILRRLRELGYVAPRKIKRDKVEYAGAEILEPEPGLKRDVAVFDFISLYPSIILRDSVDVFGFSGEVLPYYISQFLRLKNECDAKGDSVGKDIWKILMNSAYGMFGYVGSRYYDAKKAEHITREGRKALLSVVDYLTSMGIRVYAGDTDSVFIDATTVENLSAIERMLNKRFYPLQVKLDKYFQTVLFAGREGKGVKKRYIGLTKQGKIVARGFEVRRGDWCLFTKKAVLDVANMILTGSDLQKVSEKVSEIRATLFSGKVEKQDLVINRQIRKGEYKVETFWVKLWKQAVAEGKIPKDTLEVSFIYTKSGPKLFDEAEGYDAKAYWDRQVYPPIKRLLDSLRQASTLAPYLSTQERGDGEA